MNQESPWKKNRILNIGVLAIATGSLILTFFEKAQLLGTAIATTGLVMFYIGYRKAKTSGIPPVPSNVRQRKLRIMIISLVFAFLLSPIFLWPQISKLSSNALWIFISSDLVSMVGILSFYVWLYKIAGKDTTEGR